MGECMLVRAGPRRGACPCRGLPPSPSLDPRGAAPPVASPSRGSRGGFSAWRPGGRLGGQRRLRGALPPARGCAELRLGLAARRRASELAHGAPRGPGPAALALLRCTGPGLRGAAAGRGRCHPDEPVLHRPDDACYAVRTARPGAATNRRGVPALQLPGGLHGAAHPPRQRPPPLRVDRQTHRLGRRRRAGEPAGRDAEADPGALLRGGLRERGPPRKLGDAKGPLGSIRRGALELRGSMRKSVFRVFPPHLGSPLAPLRSAVACAVSRARRTYRTKETRHPSARPRLGPAIR